MTANEKMIGGNNLQNVLFPLEYMYITQKEYGTYSHKDSMAMDFAGYSSSGVVTNCPYYAPCDLTLVKIYGSTSPIAVWQSNKKVNFIDGTIDYLTIGFAHDDNITTFTVGDTRKQGEIIGHTGTYGHATGDHVHIEMAKGEYAGFYQNDYGVWCLNNQVHIYNTMGVNNTKIIVGDDYNWRKFIPYVATKKKSIIPLCMCKALRGVITT